MKPVFYILIFLCCQSVFGQCQQQTIIPLRTYTDIPKDACYYMKDTQNELQSYVGTWKATWEDKTIWITFKKILNKYDDHFKYNKDMLIAKFKVTNANGQVLFDNTSIQDINAKINGAGYIKNQSKYLLTYYDRDLCLISGHINIDFTDATKTQLQWKYIPNKTTIFPDCPFYNSPSSQYPKPLPKNAVLIKQ